MTHSGAVQARDYAGAKGALGQRLQKATDTAIGQAFNEGRILRTHVLRPTWHFVTPGDIRWMLELTAPRVHAANAFMYRKLELDSAVFRRSHRALTKALQGGKQLTRPELKTVLQRAGVNADGLRLGYLVMRAELDRVICSGARRGRQFTYALLEERVPQTRPLSREEALAELTTRYFRSRGPATLNDFAWWSGLTMADAKKAPRAYFLPNYDDYFIGFRDRSAIAEVVRRSNLLENNPSLIPHLIILDGQIVGGWKRTLKKGIVIVEVNLITDLTVAAKQIVTDAVDRYGKFLGLPPWIVGMG